MTDKIGRTGITAAGIILFFCSMNMIAKDIFSSELVARKDFAPNLEWRLPPVMGRDFWNILEIEVWDYYSCLGPGVDQFCFRKLKNTPVYKESGRYYGGQGTTIVNKENKTITISEIFNSWNEYKKDLFRKAFEADENPNAPWFFGAGDMRPAWHCVEYNKGNTTEYKEFKKKYPNFMGFDQGEWCNECILTGPWLGRYACNRSSEEIIAKAKKEFPTPSSRTESVALVKKLFNVLQELYFNDPGKLGVLRSCMNVDHYAYEYGADIAWLETTNSGWDNNQYRWNSSLFFVRGASHQYNKRWGWYLASYYNGYTDKGLRISDAHVHYYHKKREGNYGWKGPNCGMSLSLYRRGMYLAYLSGPTFITHEAIRKFVDKDGAFSPWGKALVEWFEFTQKNKRGINYAPVALLIPFEQCYPAFGGKSWFRYKYERPDWMIDAFMFTITPNNPMIKKGNEGCLFNSPYGDIYDVILPDTPQKPVKKEVLDQYKIAVMLGSYNENKDIARSLVEYVRDGGTLLINIKQLNQFFPSVFTGIIRSNKIQLVASPVVSVRDGTRIPLTDKYEFEKVNLNGAKALIVDSNQNVIACINHYGKGNVIVATVDNMVPVDNMAEQGDVLGNFIFGKRFPFVEYFLEQIVEETLPLQVKGDIEYGLNKLDDGWLLYLINNNGVTKFVDMPQIVDPMKASTVEVFLKDIDATTATEQVTQEKLKLKKENNSFTIKVPAGDVRIVKIK